MEIRNKFPFEREVLGCVLGPAKGADDKMAQWVLKATGRVVPRRTLRPLKPTTFVVQLKYRNVDLRRPH